MNYKNIEKFISELRLGKKLTQEELAILLNVNNRTISKWENGINVPDTIYLYKLSKIFKVSVGEIIDGKRKNLSKKVNIKIALFIIMILLLFLTTLFYNISNYNKINIFNIESIDNNYLVDGYLLTTPKLNFFHINSVKYLNSRNPNVTSYNLTIYANNKLFYSFYDDDISISLDNLLKSISINYIDDSKKINNLKLCITYTDKDNVKYKNYINLILNKSYSNNKIIY